MLLTTLIHIALERATYQEQPQRVMRCKRNIFSGFEVWDVHYSERSGFPDNDLTYIGTYAECVDKPQAYN